MGETVFLKMLFCIGQFGSFLLPKSNIVEEGKSNHRVREGVLLIDLGDYS